MTLRRTIAACFMLFSCGGSPPVENARPLSSAQARPQVAPKAKRAPSAEIAAYFPRGAAQTALYVDVAGLAQAEVVRGVLANVGTLADAATAKCIGDAARAIHELVIGIGDGGTLGVIRYDASKLDTKTCFDGALVAATPTIALFGTKTLVERGPVESGHLHSSLALGDGEWARLAINNEEMHVSASLAITPALLALRAEGNIPEPVAREWTRDFEKSRATLPAEMKDASSDERELLAKVLRFTTMTNDHGHMTFAIELREPTVDQARDVGIMAALATAGVRKYLLASKEVEARNTVPEIAKDIVAQWERETFPQTPRAKKKLQSFPPIPQAVPRGTKYQSSEKEWATWSAIKFEMSQPQFYQYEVRAAKDGESAEVIARGDLNGDGKTSAFVITIKVKKDKERSLELSPMVETDPDE